MEPLKGRMDFEFETMRQEFVKQIEEKINVEVAQRAPDARQDSAARRGLSDSRPDPHQDQPAAGRHSPKSAPSRSSGWTCRPTAARTWRIRREVGRIRVVDYKSKGKINKRIEVALDE